MIKELMSRGRATMRFWWIIIFFLTGECPIGDTEASPAEGDVDDVTAAKIVVTEDDAE